MLNNVRLVIVYCFAICYSHHQQNVVTWETIGNSNHRHFGRVSLMTNNILTNTFYLPCAELSNILNSVKC